jgi:restriction endonuclease Mrr
MSRRRTRQAKQNSLTLPVALALLFLLVVVLYYVVAYIADHPWVLLLPLAIMVGVSFLGVYIVRQRAEDNQQWLQAQARQQQAVEEQRLHFAQHIGNLLALSPREFELTVGSLLQAQGYQQVRHTGASGDLAADLHAFSPQGEYVVVQCKRYAPGQKVGTPDIQKFIGMMTVHHRAQRGIFVTTSSFTAPAQALAQQHPLELIDGQRLTALAAQVQSARVSPRLSN